MAADFGIPVIFVVEDTTYVATASSSGLPSFSYYEQDFACSSQTNKRMVVQERDAGTAKVRDFHEVEVRKTNAVIAGVLRIGNKSIPEKNWKEATWSGKSTVFVLWKASSSSI